MDARPISIPRRREGTASSRPRLGAPHLPRLRAVDPPAGAVRAWRDDNGAEHFSFPQQIWLYPDIQMQATPEYSRAAEVLAVNILAQVLPERDYRVWGGMTSSRAVALAQVFFDECLANRPTMAWRIDFDTLQEWIVAVESRRSGL